MEVCDDRGHAAARGAIVGTFCEVVGGDRIADRSFVVVGAVHEHRVLHPQRAEPQIAQALGVPRALEPVLHPRNGLAGALDLAVEEVAEGQRARDAERDFGKAGALGQRVRALD